MSQFPILETERFVIRQIKQDDSKEIFQYFSMDEVTQFYDLESFTTIEQAEELIRRWNQRFENIESKRL
jgi:ribosomal-protein-alanine N-acetyltransferase